jgi:3-hydroxyacyl-[acyl-carrier-protein] dehydratase
MPSLHIPSDHACFPGHFPGQPILPGVLLLERVMAQAQSQWGRTPDQYTLVNTKFLAAVLPGDTVRIELTAVHPGESKFTVHTVSAEGADAVLACSGQLRIAPSPTPAGS